MFDDRISLTVDAYKRKSFDLIGDFRTGGIGGESVKKANYADMKSQGIEVALGGTVVKTGAFNWKTQIIFAHNTNKITNLKSQPLIFGLTGADGGALEAISRGLFSLDFKGLDPNNGSPSFINNMRLVMILTCKVIRFSI